VPDWLDTASPNEKEKPLKHTEEIHRNMELIHKYSPDFSLKKLNNYDNHSRHAPKVVYEKFRLDKS